MAPAKMVLASFPVIAAASWLLCAQTIKHLNYPPAPAGDQTDDYHGTKIADRYRILEDADAPVTRKWVDLENELTAAWLAKQPDHDKTRTELSALWN